MDSGIGASFSEGRVTGGCSTKLCCSISGSLFVSQVTGAGSNRDGNCGRTAIAGESVRVQFTLPDHEATCSAESTICWGKTGQLGIRFVSISDEHTSELQVWLSQKLEETLPEFVAGQFQKAELCSK